MHLEKNDVDVSSLFTWGTKFDVLDASGKTAVSLYMRLVGDADLNRARVYALRKSAEKRKHLKDENSDDFFAYIQPIDAFEKDKLVGLCSLFASKDLAKEAIKAVDVKAPREPGSDASLEEQENYQLEIDAYPDKLDAALREYITKRVETVTKSFEEKTKEELYELYTNYFIDEICEAEMLSAFKDMCTYCGTYKDAKYKDRFFGSFDEFLNLDFNMKQQFISAYESLDVNPSELKKLQVATQ